MLYSCLCIFVSYIFLLCEIKGRMDRCIVCMNRYDVQFLLYVAFLDMACNYGHLSSYQLVISFNVLNQMVTVCWRVVDLRKNTEMNRWCDAQTSILKLVFRYIITESIFAFGTKRN